MATSTYGIAYLDLNGNRVFWSPSDQNHDHVHLDGSHFHDTVRMAAVVISAICLLSLIAMLMAVCFVSLRYDHSSTYLFLAWASLCCLIWYCIS
jgi:hypothetical protein